jgi:hypothetical protein
MFWYDLKLWQFFKMKHKIEQNLYIFTNIYSKLIVKKHMTYRGNYKYNK